MRKSIACVHHNEAFAILAKGFRYNPYRLALLRRIYVGRFSHQPDDRKTVRSARAPKGGAA